MSKEQAEEPVLWYRPRTDLSGQVTIPPEKSPKKPESKPSKKPEESPSKKPESAEVLIISSEKQSSEASKKKRGRKPKPSECLEVSTTESKTSKLQDPKPNESLESSLKKLKKTSKASEKLSLLNGYHSQDAIVLIDDEVAECPSPAPKKSSDVINEKISEPPSKISELERIVKEKIKKVQEQDKRPSSSSSKALETPVFTASPAVEKEKSSFAPRRSQSCSSGLTCPDPGCLKVLPDHKSLLEHIKESHSLQCKMPYCTFLTFTFQDYLEHFEEVHCTNTLLPQKRGPRVASKEPLPLKETKVST